MPEGCTPTKEYCISMRDAAFPKPFYQGLEFNSPAHGAWNIVHIGMLLPGARQIYVCSANCMRGVVLTAAEMDAADRFSFVILDEADMTLGNLEAVTIDGVSRCIDLLEEHPPVVLLFTVCVHHFLGCDLDYVYRKLGERYPDIFFARCYMDPLLQKTRPTPDQKLRLSMYDPIRPLPIRKNTISLIGSELPLYKSCDIYKVIEAVSGSPAANAYSKAFNPVLRNLSPDYYDEYGTVCPDGHTRSDISADNRILLRELPTCRDYSEYLSMGESSLFLAANPSALMGLKHLGERLGRPVLYIPMSFDPQEIKDSWLRLAKALSDCCDIPGGADIYNEKSSLSAAMDDMYERSISALSGTLKLTGSTEIRIDAAFHPRPLGLARLLLEQGFNVTTVYLDSVSDGEREAFDWLKSHRPMLRLHSTVQSECRVLDRGHPDVLAIGQKAAWFSGTGHFVDAAQGAGLWGFDGIIRLSKLMTKAYLEEKDTRGLIVRKGWGCASCV